LKHEIQCHLGRFGTCLCRHGIRNDATCFAIALGIGMLFGGAVALPLAASNLFAALAARRLTREQAFGTQFGTFALLSFVFYYAVLVALNDGMQILGGIDLSGNGLVVQAGFVIASLLLALLLMALGIKPRTAWTG
jgi:hypothetical protein